MTDNNPLFRPAKGPSIPMGSIIEGLNPTPKRPSEQIREKVEELTTGFLATHPESPIFTAGDSLFLEITAIKDYLDHQAGFPKSE